MIQYRVPAGYGEAELTEKHSRFISRIWPVETESEAIAKIKKMREKYWDASHNVYSYILRTGSIMRYSDDGEPQGTSGIPTLSVFRNEEIFNFCCVTTRYFGGILLGAGGLVRAYSAAAKMALEAAGIAVMASWNQFLLSCSYSQYEKIRNELSVLGAITEDTDFGVDIVISALIQDDKTEILIKNITEITAGSVTIEILGSEFRAVQLK